MWDLNPPDILLAREATTPSSPMAHIGSRRRVLETPCAYHPEFLEYITLNLLQVRLRILYRIFACTSDKDYLLVSYHLVSMFVRNTRQN